MSPAFNLNFCFSQGIEKLNHHDKGVLMNMLNLADISKPSFVGGPVQRGGKSHVVQPSSGRVSSEQISREQSSRERFTWPQPNNQPVSSVRVAPESGVIHFGCKGPGPA